MLCLVCMTRCHFIQTLTNYKLKKKFLEDNVKDKNYKNSSFL